MLGIDFERAAFSRASLVFASVGAAGVMLLSGSSVASADPVADKSRTVNTDDGWSLTVTKSAENLDRYPNLAATMFTREGFVSLKARADISGAGTAVVNSGIVTLGYQIGCQIDVSTGITAGLALSIGPSVGVTISSFPGANAGLNASVSPSLSTTLKPGTITSVPFGSKTLAASRGSITAEQVQVKIDGCLGPVSLRSYATAAISTATADNSVTVYGDPIWL